MTRTNPRQQNKKPFNYAKFWRRTALILYDVLSVIAASFLALVIRYEFRISDIPDYFLQPVVQALPFMVIVTIVLIETDDAML